LDTDTCIYYLNRYSDKLLAQFRKFSPSDIKLSSITVAELYFGAEKSRAKKMNWAILENFTAAFEIVPFDDVCCKIYANIRASLEKSGTPIGPMDLLIAAISLGNNFILVTNNTKEFRRIKKLKLENWL
jgi:tRNA(fMet)-specific endonuclease VapC